MIIREHKRGFFFSFLGSLVLIIIILLTSVQYNVLDINFYRSEYAKLQSTETIGISEQDLMRVTEVLLAYVRADRGNLQVEAEIKGEKRQVFNEREIAHMAEVQLLYIRAIIMRNSFVFAVFFLVLLTRVLTLHKFWRVWATAHLTATAVFVVLSFLLVRMVTGNFTEFWHAFHRLFFTGNLWQLNPETDILIQIVPEQFFYDLVLRILTYFGSAVLILAVAAVLILVLKRNREPGTEKAGIEKIGMEKARKGKERRK